jgi:putative transposase
MANSGARPNSESSSFPCKRLPRCSEASSWPGSLRCLTRESCTCPIPNSKYLPTVLAGSPCSTTSALVLYAKRPFGGPQQVLSYLANYTHRVALSNRRIVAVDAPHQTVTFTYRDYRHGSQRKELTLSALEFIRRFSLHILPPGLVRIRHYGILANNRRKRDIEAARAIFKRRRGAMELQSQSVADPPCGTRCCPSCGKAGIRLVAFTDAAGVLHMIGVGPMPGGDSS